MSNPEAGTSPAVEATTETAPLTLVRPLVKEIMEAVGEFTPEAITEAASIVAAGQDISVEEIKPMVAAVIFCNHNRFNRDISIAKALQWRDDMTNGEWRLNHQGLAFYVNGDIADGQHRMAGQALSGTTQKYSVFRDFGREDVDTIDLGKARTAADALQLKGIEDSKRKSAISKAVEEYLHAAEYGVKPRYSIKRLEQAVMDHDEDLDIALKIGDTSVENVTVPALTASEASTVAYLFWRGGYSGEIISGFLSSLQQGVATYPQSPTVDLNGQFTRARSTANRAHKLNKTAKMAMACKGIALWTEGKSVSRLKYSNKESLPEPTPPSVKVVEEYLA